MIWVDGQVLPDDGLTIGVNDRTFEHGLGLFETFRTWSGRPTLLDRHLRRLMDSARALDLPLDRAKLPDESAVARLRQASGFSADCLLRLTLSGGTTLPGSSVAWLRAAPLPPPTRAAGARLDSTWEVERGDGLAQCKSLNYWRRRRVHERCLAEGSDEALSLTSDGLVHEGSRTNLFVVADGRLRTPGLEGPLVPGIARGLVLELANDLGLAVREGPVSRDSLQSVEEAFLTNSVRGVIPVGRLLGRDLPAPGPLTARLAESVLSWLNRGGRG